MRPLKTQASVRFVHGLVLLPSRTDRRFGPMLEAKEVPWPIQVSFSRNRLILYSTDRRPANYLRMAEQDRENTLKIATRPATKSSHLVEFHSLVCFVEIDLQRGSQLRRATTHRAGQADHLTATKGHSIRTLLE